MEVEVSVAQLADVVGATCTTPYATDTHVVWVGKDTVVQFAVDTDFTLPRFHAVHADTVWAVTRSGASRFVCVTRRGSMHSARFGIACAADAGLVAVHVKFGHLWAERAPGHADVPPTRAHLVDDPRPLRASTALDVAWAIAGALQRCDGIPVRIVAAFTKARPSVLAASSCNHLFFMEPPSPPEIDVVTSSDDDDDDDGDSVTRP
jgi:hypothetical protein